jgi:hypothetical protein
MNDPWNSKPCSKDPNWFHSRDVAQKGQRFCSKCGAANPGFSDPDSPFRRPQETDQSIVILDSEDDRSPQQLVAQPLTINQLADGPAANAKASPIRKLSFRPNAGSVAFPNRVKPALTQNTRNLPPPAFYVAWSFWICKFAEGEYGVRHYSDHLLWRMLLKTFSKLLFD